MSLLEIRGLVAGYGRAPVLRDVDLVVEEGDALAIIGRNGSGKTSLLATIYGGTTIFSGTILVRGEPLDTRRGFRAAAHGIALAPQGKHLLPNLSVAENLMLGAASRRRGVWTLDTVYDLFPVLAQRARKPGTALSGGQQQMVSIGRALMANPALLLLDEPSEGLAPVLIDQIVDALATIHSTGTSTVIVEQHLELVTRTSREFAVMNKGQLALGGPIADVGVADLRGLLAL
ncbi:ABC transporter ATP-binding protein [Pseudonocardia ailaonensis]|uniref:ABC transporter ATP-binding protein n=1 Tax=Pseudonocardia ailaonensis TaxID=367279 RepID=A0ABN2NAY3_9PSEU